MIILVVFNSFNVVKNMKKPDPVARQMTPLYTTNIQHFKLDMKIENKTTNVLILIFPSKNAF